MWTWSEPSAFITYIPRVPVTTRDKRDAASVRRPAWVPVTVRVIGHARQTGTVHVHHEYVRVPVTARIERDAGGDIGTCGRSRRCWSRGRYGRSRRCWSHGRYGRSRRCWSRGGYGRSYSRLDCGKPSLNIAESRLDCSQSVTGLGRCRRSGRNRRSPSASGQIQACGVVVAHLREVVLNTSAQAVAGKPPFGQSGQVVQRRGYLPPSGC